MNLCLRDDEKSTINTTGNHDGAILAADSEDMPSDAEFAALKDLLPNHTEEGTMRGFLGGGKAASIAPEHASSVCLSDQEVILEEALRYIQDLEDRKQRVCRERITLGFRGIVCFWKLMNGIVSLDDGVVDEIDYSDLDDPSRVPPWLVSDSACLSQYYSRSPAQALEDTLATEETASQSSSMVSSCALAQISLMRVPPHRRESPSLPMSKSSMCHNTTSTDSPVMYTIPVSTAGLVKNHLDTHQSDDAPRSEAYHSRSCIERFFGSTDASPSSDPPRIQEKERHTRLADQLASLTGSAISLDMLSKTPTPKISNLWHYLRSQRASLPEGLDKAHVITEPRENCCRQDKKTAS